MCLTAVPWKPAQPFLRYLLPVRAGPAFPTAAAHHPAAAAPAQPRVRRQSLSAADCFRVQKLPMRVLARPWARRGGRNARPRGAGPGLAGRRPLGLRARTRRLCHRGTSGRACGCSRKPRRHAGTSGRGRVFQKTRAPRRHLRARGRVFQKTPAPPCVGVLR